MRSDPLPAPPADTANRGKPFSENTRAAIVRRTAAALVAVVCIAGSTGPAAEAASPQVAFAREEIRQAAELRGVRQAVAFAIDAENLGPQGYRIEREANGTIRVIGGDAVGAMYGGLDVAEAIRMNPHTEDVRTIIRHFPDACPYLIFQFGLNRTTREAA